MDQFSYTSIAISYFIHFFICSPLSSSYTSVSFLRFYIYLVIFTSPLPRYLLACCPVLFPVSSLYCMSWLNNFLLCFSSSLFFPSLFWNIFSLDPLLFSSLHFSFNSILFFTVLVIPFFWLSILSRLLLSSILSSHSCLLLSPALFFFLRILSSLSLASCSLLDPWFNRSERRCGTWRTCWGGRTLSSAVRRPKSTSFKPLSSMLPYHPSPREIATDYTSMQT